MPFKQAAVSVLKLAISLSIAGLVVAGVVAGGVALYEYKEKLDSKPYEVPVAKNLETGKLGFDLSITTKYSDYSMKFILKGTGYPFYFSDPVLRAKNNEGQLTITAKGSDGFKVSEIAAPVKNLIAIIDANGKPSGFNYEGEVIMSLDNYKKVHSFDLGWNFHTEKEVKADESKPLDHCAPGLSKAERLRRLGARGSVRVVGEGSYAAGTSSLSFFYDGGILSCN